MLEIRNFSKTYDEKKKAVDNLSLSIEPGDLYGFIGANGAGKTSTIKAVAGIHDFDSGSIHICGHSIKEEPLLCKSIMAYIPDNPDLYEHLTGYQYISFIADLFQVSDTDRTEKTKKYGEMFEMTGSLGNMIASYSHGMKQRTAIISALIHSPKLLILDEPFVGLDPKAAFTLKKIMEELTWAGGAIFFSTHVLDVAEKLCNKIAIIKNGRLIASGLTETVIGNPINELREPENKKKNTAVTFFVPLIPMCLASVIGVLIVFSSSHFKNRNIISLLLSFTALG